MWTLKVNFDGPQQYVVVTFFADGNDNSESQRPHCSADPGEDLCSQAQTSRGKHLAEPLRARLSFIADVRHLVS